MSHPRRLSPEALLAASFPYDSVKMRQQQHVQILRAIQTRDLPLTMTLLKQRYGHSLLDCLEVLFDMYRNEKVDIEPYLDALLECNPTNVPLHLNPLLGLLSTVTTWKPENYRLLCRLYTRQCPTLPLSPDFLDGIMERPHLLDAIHDELGHLIDPSELIFLMLDVFQSPSYTKRPQPSLATLRFAFRILFHYHLDFISLENWVKLLQPLIERVRPFPSYLMGSYFVTFCQENWNRNRIWCLCSDRLCPFVHSKEELFRRNPFSQTRSTARKNVSPRS